MLKSSINFTMSTPCTKPLLGLIFTMLASVSACLPDPTTVGLTGATGAETGNGGESTQTAASDSSGLGETSSLDSSTGDSTGSSTTGSTGEPATNPGPDEPCDPFEALSGMRPCEAPDGDPNEYGCTIVVVDMGPAPDFTNVWGFRCALLVATQPDHGFEPGDYCSPSDYSSEGSWTSGCAEGLCTAKYVDPPLAPNGDRFLPDTLCPDESLDDGGPGATHCCTSYCDPDELDPCGPGMKCVPSTHSQGPTEDGTPIFGHCFDQEFNP